MYPRPSPITRMEQQASQVLSVAPFASVTRVDQLMLEGLENDILRLKTVNSFSRKQEIKRLELLPRYRDYLTTYMLNGKKPSTVLIRNMIWAFDAEDPEYAMTLATYALKQGGATMPEGFKRDFPNYVLGTVGDLAVNQAKDKKPITPYIETVYAWLNEHPHWDIVDKIKAEVLKGLAFYLESHNPTHALELFEQAQVLDSGANVRRKIASLKGDISP